jgi:hypothetical protein
MDKGSESAVFYIVGYYYYSEAGHILYLRILYPIHIQAQKKDIISYHFHGKKKDMDILCVPLIPQQLAAGPA